MNASETSKRQVRRHARMRRRQVQLRNLIAGNRNYGVLSARDREEGDDPRPA